MRDHDGSRHAASEVLDPAGAGAAEPQPRLLDRVERLAERAEHPVGLTNGRRFFRPDMGQATMPIEFQGACFRVGHTMIRPSYRANLKGMDGKPFFGFIFDPALGDITPASGLDPADLRSGFRAPRRFIGWQTFFDFKDGEVKRNKLIDNKISTPLFTLPLGAIASHKAPIALMQRNLLRHITWSMPSGQSIAREMGVDLLSAADLDELRMYDMDLEKNTPLFYYMLKESGLVPSSDIGKNTGGFTSGRSEAASWARSSWVSCRAILPRTSRNSPCGRQRCRTRARASVWSTSSPSRAWTQRRGTRKSRSTPDPPGNILNMW